MAAYRLPYLLAGGSLVLKQDSEYYEHFYHLLEPWVHYVPVKSDISDLDEKLQWAMDNDKKVAVSMIAYFAPFFFHSSHLSFFYLCSIPLSSIHLLLYLSYLLFLLNHLCPFQAKQIADNAFQFVVDNLLPDKLYCYLVTLFKASQQSSY